MRLRQGFEYKMRFVYSHFPINVAITGNKNKIEIRNFLGEKIVRTVDAYPGVTATRSSDVKDEIVVVGNDIDNVSKTWYAMALTACCAGHASGRGRRGRSRPRRSRADSPPEHHTSASARRSLARFMLPNARCLAHLQCVVRCSVAVLWSSRFAR